MKHQSTKDFSTISTSGVENSVENVKTVENPKNRVENPAKIPFIVYEATMARMDGGNSYARYGNVRRDNMGRYSRDEANEEIINRLHEVMNDATNEQTKQEIRKLINKMEQM